MRLRFPFGRRPRPLPGGREVSWHWPLMWRWRDDDWSRQYGFRHWGFWYTGIAP
jgi:hypothetical protein